MLYLYCSCTEELRNKDNNREKKNEVCEHIRTMKTEAMSLAEHLQEIYESSIRDLSHEEANLVKTLLLKHTSVFSKSCSDLGYCDIIPHRINTGLAAPIRLPP